MITRGRFDAGLFIMLAYRKQLAKSTLETENARGGAL